MSAFQSPWQAIQQHQSSIEQIRQNSARTAWSYARIDTAGSGHHLFPDAVEFSCTFIENPHISYGHLWTPSATAGSVLPRVHGGVRRWRTNRKGHFTGCWVYFVVETDDDEPVDVQHYFTFAGVAIKDLPAHLLDY